MPEKISKPRLAQLGPTEARDILRRYGIDTTGWEAPPEVDDIRMMKSRTHITPYEEGRRQSMHWRADLALLAWLQKSGHTSRKEAAMKKAWSRAYIKAEEVRKEAETKPDKNPE